MMLQMRPNNQMNFEGILTRAKGPQGLLQSSRERHWNPGTEFNEFSEENQHPKVILDETKLTPDVDFRIIQRQNKMISKNEKDPKSRLIDQLLEEIDELKEQANVREMKLETLNFRCEKLQEDITKKHEQTTLLKNKNLEQAEYILELNSKLEKAQRENRINREDIGPRLDALKSRYEVCMLEMVSLENDNKILTERNKQILRQDTELRKRNRELKKEIFDEKQERLQMCKEFETLQRDLELMNEKIEDLKINKEELEETNKRLKNEKDSSMRKVEILERENFRLHTLKNQARFQEVERVVDSKDTVFMDFPEKRKNQFKKPSYVLKSGKVGKGKWPLEKTGTMDFKVTNQFSLKEANLTSGIKLTKSNESKSQ